jgi:glycopeptide antibiotics resistance protein
MAEAISVPRVAGPLLVVYLSVVAVIVFWPSGEMASNSVVRLWAVLDVVGVGGLISPLMVEFVTNVLLFVPLTLLGPTFRPAWRWARWLLAGLAGTAFIELSQMLLLPNRSPALLDVAANTFGALLGYWCRIGVRHRFHV